MHGERPRLRTGARDQLRIQRRSMSSAVFEADDSTISISAEDDVVSLTRGGSPRRRAGLIAWSAVIVAIASTLMAGWDESSAPLMTGRDLPFPLKTGRQILIMMGSRVASSRLPPPACLHGCVGGDQQYDCTNANSCDREQSSQHVPHPFVMHTENCWADRCFYYPQ